MDIFFENSKRNITISKCREILNQIEGKVNTVAVTVDPTYHDLKIYSKIFAYGDSRGDKELLEFADISYFKPFT